MEGAAHENMPDGLDGLKVASAVCIFRGDKAIVIFANERVTQSDLDQPGVDGTAAFGLGMERKEFSRRGACNHVTPSHRQWTLALGRVRQGQSGIRWPHNSKRASTCHLNIFLQYVNLTRPDTRPRAV